MHVGLVQSLLKTWDLPTFQKHLETQYGMACRTTTLSNVSKSSQNLVFSLSRCLELIRGNAGVGVDEIMEMCYKHEPFVPLLRLACIKELSGAGYDERDWLSLRQAICEVRSLSEV